MPITFSRRPWSIECIGLVAGAYIKNANGETIGMFADRRDADEVVAAFSDISNKGHASLIEENRDLQKEVDKLEKELIELETKMENIEKERIKNE